MWNNIKTFWQKEKLICIIALISVIASLVYSFGYRIRPAVDAFAYDQVGWHLATGQAFRLDLSAPLIQDEAITYQGPLYQFFIACLYWLFGHHYEAIWIAQALLRGLSVIILFLLCREIFGSEQRQIGWIAGTIFGLHPDLVEISAMLMTETVFIFLSILLVYVIVRFENGMNIKRAMLLGIIFAAAVLARSTIGILGLVIAWLCYRQRAWKPFIVFVMIGGLLMTPWIVRNYRTYHIFLPTMANFGYNFWVGNRIDADGEGGNPQVLLDAIKEKGAIEANYYALAQFKTFIKAHPLQYLKLTGSRVLKYFSPLRPMGFWFYQKGIGQLIFVTSSALTALILFITSFAGLGIAWQEERQNIRLRVVGITALLTCLSIVLILVETRYRLPIYPFLAVFSGLAAQRLLQNWQQYKIYLIKAFAVVGAIMVWDVALEYDKVIEKLRG